MMHTSVIDFDTCGQLIHASQDRLYRLAYCYVKNEHDALDIIPTHEPDLTPEEQMDLYRLLDSLPTEEGTYLLLHYFEERSFPEMAEILSMPEAKLKSRFYRILHRLRAHLKEESL